VKRVKIRHDDRGGFHISIAKRSLFDLYLSTSLGRIAVNATSLSHPFLSHDLPSRQ
jgi:hypothetical protein